MDNLTNLIIYYFCNYSYALSLYLALANIDIISMTADFNQINLKHLTQGDYVRSIYNRYTDNCMVALSVENDVKGRQYHYAII